MRRGCRADQFTVQALLEIIAACALVFAVLPYRNLVWITGVLALLALWSLRVSNWSVRWPLTVSLGGCGILSFGLCCVEQAFTRVDPPAPARLSEQLAFFGSMTATLGAFFGVAGFALLLFVLVAARRDS